MTNNIRSDNICIYKFENKYIQKGGKYEPVYYSNPFDPGGGVCKCDQTRFRHLKNLKEKNPRINTGFSSLFVSKTCCMESLAGNFFDFFI